MTHFKTFNKPTLYDEGIIVSASNSVEPTVEDKWRRFYGMVETHCLLFEMGSIDEPLRSNRLKDIAKECGIEV